MNQTQLRIEFMKDTGRWPPIRKYNDGAVSSPEEYVEWLEERVLRYRLKYLQHELGVEIDSGKEIDEDDHLLNM